MRKFFFFLFFIFLTHICFAKEDILKSISLKNSTFHLWADRVRFDNENKIIEAFSNVYFFSSDYKIWADYARYEEENKKIYLKGHVKARWGLNEIKADEILVYVTNSTGWIRGGEIFYSVPHLYFKGKEIKKTGKETYSFHEIEVTGCDGESPDWSFWIKKGFINDDGEAKLYHVKFKVKGNTIFYLPYLQLPVLVKRKSGFLVPQYISSSRDGTGLILPYYQVLSKEQDITIYPGYLSKRGVMGGIEWRFTPNVQTKGFFMLSYLRDKKFYFNDSESPYFLQGDGLIRPNKNRYWLRGKMDTFLLSPDIKVKLDIDYVSDQDFLREYDSGYLGFDLSRQTFLKEFGRDIKNKDSLIRENSLLITKRFSFGELYLKSVYSENLNYKNHNGDSSEDDTPQRVPELGLDIFKRPIFHGLFDFESQSSATYFYRRALSKGVRIDLYPSISKNISMEYLTIIPKVSFRDTAYFLDASSEEGLDQFENREFFEFDLDGYAQFYKIFSFKENSKNFFAIRHIITPEIEYFYRPLRAREDLPYFDSIDSLSREHRISYSLTNQFTLKTYDSEGKPVYRDFLRLKLSQEYDIEELGREIDLQKYPKRPFTDIRTEYDLTPFSIFSMNGNIWFSPYLKVITELEHSIYVKYDSLTGYISYDYKRKLEEDIHRKDQDGISIIRYGTTWRPNKRWTISYRDERDLDLKEVIKQEVGIEYYHQCWSSNTLMSHTQDEDKILITITLGTLGEVKQKFLLD